MATTKNKKSPNRKGIPPAQSNVLWAASAGRCNICWTSLLRDETTDVEVKAGEMAHIVGIGDGPRSARSDFPYERKYRDLATNLILLCEKHHTEIDGRPELYSVEYLRELKRDAEDRVFRLTGLKRDDKTLVVRLTGTIHSVKVPALSREEARELVLNTDGRYPHADQDHHVDLTGLADEGSASYWEQSAGMIDKRVGRIRDLQADGDVAHLSVFGLARIPALVQLGAALGDTSDVTTYHRRNDAGWGWDLTADLPEFVIVKRHEGDGKAVTLACSLTGNVQLDRATEATAGTSIYEIRPADRDPGHTLMDHRNALDELTRVYRDFLSLLERDHPQATHLNLLPAVAADVAIALGRVRTPSVTPPLRVYDRVPNSYNYEFATEVGR